MNKKYYFTNDYTTSFGIVKKGDSLTGTHSDPSIGVEPFVLFNFDEKTSSGTPSLLANPKTFSIKEKDLNSFVSDVEPKNIDNKKTNDDTKETKKGWKSWSKAKKGLVIGGVILGVAGVVTAFLLIRKNK